MSTTNAGLSRRRRAVAGGTVATLALASAAWSIVPTASATPTPQAARTKAAPGVPAPALGRLTARTIDGVERTVPLGASPLARRLGSGGPAGTGPVASRSAGAATVSAAAAAAPAAYVPIGTTGLVASASPTLAFAPDGSRVAWVTGKQVYSAHPGGKGLLAVGTRSGIKRIAWSPDGRFVALGTARGISVVTAAYGQVLDTRRLPADDAALSWLTSGVLVASHAQDWPTFELVPVFGGKVRRYATLTGRQVLDAVGSPDGSKVAVRISDERTGASVESLVVVDAKTLRDVATVVPTTGKLGRPAWSSDSATVYVPRTEDGVTSIVAHAATTADGDPVVVLADAGTTPYIYRRPVSAGRAYGDRVTGRDAVATSVALSKEGFTKARGASCNELGAAVSAVLAKSGSVEAAVGAPLAAHTCGPLLLTGSRSLDGRTAAELKRLLRRGRTVRLVGPTTSLSASVAKAVSRLGLKPVRYAGTNVYGTAVQVAVKGWKKHDVAAMASASQPLAAVAAAGSAGSADVPLLLTAGKKMPAVTGAYLQKYRVGAWVVGSQGVKAAPWAYRYTGTTDTAASLALARGFYYPPRIAVLVGPDALADAYAAAGYAALSQDPVLVVTRKALPAAVRTYLDQGSAGLEGVRVFGSGRALSSAVLTNAVAAAGGRTR